jgi:hypothetical protein
MLKVMTQMPWMACFLGASSLLFAATEPKQKAVVSNTQHLDFPAGGVLRFVHSTGDLTIEAWDQPGIEMTTIKSSKEDYDGKDREKAASEFQQIQIKTERKGDELVVTTEFPHLALPPPTHWGAATNFGLEYRIKAPRNARLSIDHNIGEVHIEDITGEIHVTEKQGLILLHLPAAGKYAIDARSGLGAVNSDFPGAGQRAGLIFGRHFIGNASGDAQKLTLRVRYGDIVILKENSPAAAR